MMMMMMWIRTVMMFVNENDYDVGDDRNNNTLDLVTNCNSN